MAKIGKREDKRPVGIEVDQGIVRANINRQEVAAADFVSLYANDTQIQMSPWDIRFIFGEITGLPTGPEQTSITVKTTGEVRMSPQHAKRVMLVLQRQLELYEQMIGPIPMPREA